MTELSDKSARKFRDHDGARSQQTSDHTYHANHIYRTRNDPFADVWGNVQQRPESEPQLNATTLFEWWQQPHEGLFPDSTRRTFERCVIQWRSLHGRGKTVYFDQEHRAGRLAGSGFTACTERGVKIAGRRFGHTFSQCVLTYSNVESVSLCFSEPIESLSASIQKAFWDFRCVSELHRVCQLVAVATSIPAATAQEISCGAFSAPRIDVRDFPANESAFELHYIESDRNPRTEIFFSLLNLTRLMACFSQDSRKTRRNQNV